MNCSAFAVHLANVIKANDEEVLHLVIAEDKKQAYFIVSDLDNFLLEENLYFFPATSEKSEYKRSTALLQRTSSIAAIDSFKACPNVSTDFKTLRGDFGIKAGTIEKKLLKSIVIVTYTEAMEEKVLSTAKVRESLFSLKAGDSMTHSSISEKLFSAGFCKVDFVTEPGQFALRGSLVDVFSFADEMPVRIDFFGDEVESIHHFNPDDQLSQGAPLKSMDIYPNIDENFNVEDYVDFETILPQNTVKWNLTDGTLETEDIAPQPVFAKNFDLLAKDIIQKQAIKFNINILSPNESQTRRLKEILRNFKIGSDGLNFLSVSLHEGYIDKYSGQCWYTDHQIFERYHKIKVHRQVERSERMTLAELNALKIGDYVVHIDHGVGQFGGLVKTNYGGRQQEAIKILYKDGDVILMSIHSLHRIARYKSRDGEPPKIYKLGSKAWSNLKNNAKSKVKDIAEDLIKLYSERQQARGYAFSSDSYLQQELESSFMYEDTPDQSKATEAVKADMESTRPMDRLVCGDVGFGKTEVAVRAAFKAVCDSKQVAVLVPTTILALQHYNTFRSRLKDFPCTVDYISRLRTAKEIKDIAARLAEGKIDILIGTHRILNKALNFKDLGLLIIDEEQKFGVTAKEKIRRMKSSVDTLTLTATPIPRTLQFSLLGARDLSIINTPPPNRIPVHTEVIGFDDEYIADIIGRELFRGGQVFFVHNRVEDIFRMRDRLQALCPKASICVAHGQMDPEELEKKIMEFINGDHDILLSTTIIENGIDIPNANTMIVDRAHRFGLSDLHQLRGRVGRSNVKSFCYLIVPEEERMTDDAKRRIRALEAFSDLGSGFNIAMQDLDIRGAGNLLGAEQSGFMAEMGFETYMRILREAMQEFHFDSGGEGFPAANALNGLDDVQIDTDLEVYFPDDYVNVPSEKIRLYKELNSIRSEDLLGRFTTSLADRFGSPVPVQALELIDIVRLRFAASKLFIERIVLKNNSLIAYFISDRQHPFYDSELFSSILAKIASGRRFKILENNDKLYIKTDGVKSVQEALNVIRSFLV